MKRSFLLPRLDLPKFGRTSSNYIPHISLVHSRRCYPTSIRASLQSHPILSVGFNYARCSSSRPRGGDGTEIQRGAKRSHRCAVLSLDHTWQYSICPSLARPGSSKPHKRIRFEYRQKCAVRVGVNFHRRTAFSSSDSADSGYRSAFKALPPKFDVGSSHGNDCAFDS